MKHWVYAAALALSFCFIAGATQDETATIAQSFAEHLAGGEVTGLERTFTELKTAHVLDEEQWSAVAPVFNALKVGLTDASPAGARASALRFVLLNNYLEILRLGNDCAVYGCATELQASDAHYREAFRLLAGSGALTPDSERAIGEATRGAEAEYARAQAGLVHGKELENVHDLAIRVRSLGEIESAGAYDEAFQDLRQAEERYRAGDDTSGSTLVTQGLHRLFDNSLNARFDNRHLLHLVGLRLVIAELGKSADLSESEKNGLRADYQALVNTTDPTSYDRAAASLQARVMQLVRDRNLAQQDPWLVVRLSPSAVQRNAAARMTGLRQVFGGVRERFENNQTFLQGLNRWKNHATLAALDQIDEALTKAAKRVAETTSPDLIFNAHRDGALIELVTRYFLEAVLNRSSTTDGYAQFLLNHLAAMNGTHRFFDEAAQHEVFELLRQERREGVFRAYVNRETVTLGAVSVALIAEAVSIPFTGGGSASAMPATLQAISSASLATSKAVLLATSALNIADRTKAGGWSGLVNLDTAFDALVILSLSPRFTPGGAPATTTVGRWGQNTLTKIAQLQYSSATVLTGLGTVYGGYLVYNADKVAFDLGREGVHVTPAEVRRRGMINIALGLLAATENLEYYRNGHATNGGRFDSEIEPGTVKGTLESYRDPFRPFTAAREAYRLHPSVFQMVKSVGIGLMYASEDFVLLNEAILFSYTNLDSRYLNQVQARHPFPDLRPGETAVILVGFDEEDPLLYNGAHAQHSNRRELEKYGENVYVYDFTSPENLVNVLKKHAREHGPVRYLKISTHGRPGLLYTRTVAAAPEEDGNQSGWINVPWLRSHKASLQQAAREIFAPDARLVLWACLTGANIENKFTGAVQRKGDEFLSELGDTLLVGGGAIDASTRILVGMDATIGAFAHSAFKNSFAAGEAEKLDLKLGAQRYPTIPFFPILMETGAAPATGASEAQGSASAGSNRLIDSAKYMAHRMANMVLHMPLLWYQYGVSLEGPWWASRYKYVEFASH